MPVKLPNQPGDDLESQAGSGMIDIETRGQADSMVGNLHLEVSFDFTGADIDHAAAIGVCVFHGVADEFVDQEPQWNGMVGRNKHRISMAVKDVCACRALQPAAKLVHEIRHIDKPEA